MPKSYRPAIESRQKQEILFEIEKAKKSSTNGTTFNYNDRDVILYNLSVGVTPSELAFTYERHEAFQVLPTYAAIPWFGTATPWNLGSIVKEFSPAMLLHGEHYVEIRKFPVPISAETRTYPKLIDVIDKGVSAIVIEGFTTRDLNTGEDLFYNESSIFIRGSGGFQGSPQSSTPRPMQATAPNLPPQREPDASIEENIPESLSVLYRLNGDRNDVHIDLEASRAAGFERPILPGLQMLSVAGKHVFSKYGVFKNLKVRFAGVAFPGQTLKTDMWRDGSHVIFRTLVVETGKPALSAGGVELLEINNAKL